MITSKYRKQNSLSLGHSHTFGFCIAKNPMDLGDHVHCGLAGILLHYKESQKCWFFFSFNHALLKSTGASPLIPVGTENV